MGWWGAWTGSLLLAAGAAAGCGASVSMTEHERRLAEVRTEYEARLLEHRRIAERARAARAACEAELEAEADSRQLRVTRLERTLADQALETGRPRGARRAGPTLAPLREALGADGRLDAAEDEVVLTLPAGALFLEGSRSLTGAGRARIERIARALDPTPPRISVVGHTSQDLTGAEAWGLGADRARAVVVALQALGIDPSRLVLASRAGYAPSQGVDARIELRIATPAALDQGRRRRD